MTHAVMNQQVGTPLEMIGQAVRALAVEPGDIRSRLLGASRWLEAVDPEAVPEEVREELQWIRDVLTRRDPRTGMEGRLQATLATMPARTGIRLAERILSLEERLRTHQLEAPRVR